MGLWRKSVLFYLGGTAYMGLELAYRGWTHGSMFLAGGTCFLLLGGLEEAEPRLPPVLRLPLGAIVITAVELAAGLLINRDYTVWDYRRTPLNYCGQICLPYFLLWIPLGGAAMGFYRLLERKIPS